MSTLRHSLMMLLFVVVGMAICTPQTAFAQAQNQGTVAQQVAPANQPAGICGNQPLCYDTPDFAAMVMSFRTSNYNQTLKVIDIVMRFQNKTNQPLALGYVNGSGVAADDRGNRSVVGGQNAYRGIGLVNGNSFDPRFTVRPGGYGDAQFELVQQGYPKVFGFNYVLDITVSEINSYAGDQHTLGGEFPIQFQGLANGVGMSGGGAQPAYVDNSAGAAAAGAPADGTQTATASGAPASGTNPCTAAGSGTIGQAAGKATSKVSDAANTFSSFGSIFGRKKAAASATQVATAAGNCDPNAMSAGATSGAVPTTAGTVPTTIPGLATQTATTSTVAAPVGNSVLQTGTATTTPVGTTAPGQPATAYRTGVRTAVVPGANGAMAVQQTRTVGPGGQVVVTKTAARVTNPPAGTGATSAQAQQMVVTRTATRVTPPTATTGAQAQKVVTKTTVTRAAAVPAKKPATTATTPTTTGTGK